MESGGVGGRDFLKIAGAGIVGLAVGAAIGYPLGRSADRQAQVQTGPPGIPRNL